MALLRVALLLLVALAGASAQRALVVVDNHNVRATHSDFFAALKEHGISLKFMLADSPSLRLLKYGELAYDHVILFSPSAERFGGALSPQAIAQYVDAGGNVIMAASSDVGEDMRQTASEFGFEFDEQGAAVQDFFSNVDGDATQVSSDNIIAADTITGSPSRPILFRGVGLAADDSNPLVMSVLSGRATSFSRLQTAPSTQEPLVAGTSTVLVGALQARNNARVLISGSMDLFSNEFFSKIDFDNAKFAVAAALWALQERGVLRVKEAVHHRVNETEPPREYTITEEVYYGITMEERKNGEWVPFVADDVQLEFIRIDPFVRKTLKSENGVFSAVYPLPDVYGVFKFQVDYKRVGYSFVWSSQQVSVRPLLHTQYERFIFCAYPYYASAFSMMFGFLVFSIVYLHHRDHAKIE